MRVLVFEQWMGGHYFNYLECLVPCLATFADEVIVAISKISYNSDRFREKLRHYENLPNVRFDSDVPIPAPGNALAFRLTLGRHLVDAIRRNAPDYVFLPSADEQSLPYPLLARQLGSGRPFVEAILHYNGYLGRSSIRESTISAVERALLCGGTFTTLNFVNFLQVEDARSRGLRLAAFARAAGDPVPQPPKIERGSARAALGMEEAGRWIGMVGALDERKAVIETVNAFSRAKLPNDDRLLLAGKLHPAYRLQIERDHGELLKNGRIFLLDRFLNDRELQQCNAAVDVNCSVYVSFYGLSSLMLKSIAADVPVVTNARGWGSAIAKRFELGSTVDPRDTDAFAALLPKVLAASADYRRSDAVDRLMRFHSVENFTAGVTERCVRLSGQQPSPSVDWDWVMDSLPPERRFLR